MSDDSGYAKNDVTLMDIWLVIRSYRRFTFISIILAYNFSYVINLWYTSGSFAVSSLLLPMLLALYKKQLPHPTFNILTSLIVTSFWFIYGLKHLKNGYPIYPLNLEPMYPGLFASIFIWMTSNFMFRFNSRKN